MHVYIYIYIKWTVFVNVTTKSAQHEHARMIAIFVEKSHMTCVWTFSTIIYIYIVPNVLILFSSLLYF